VIDFVHCGVEYHASFTKQSLSSTLEKFLAVTAGSIAFEVGNGRKISLHRRQVAQRCSSYARKALQTNGVCVIFGMVKVAPA
jgi:hypothetical protein